MSHPLLYELNTRCRLRELSELAGSPITLADVPDAEFTRWRRLGFTHLWLMGVWQVGPRSRAVAHAAGDLQQYDRSFVAASPYAIADYRVSESLGGDDALRSFRQRLHAHGMKLLLDFVPNHIGLDHSWVTEHPEWLVQSTGETPGTFAQETARGVRWLAHGRDPYFPPWIDTAQLDYRQPALRAAMQAELQAVADRCDGVRCDMAMLVLNEVFDRTWERFPSVPFEVPVASGKSDQRPQFWSEAIAAVKRLHPGFLFLAEAYWNLEERLQSLGFDYTYDKTLYDEIVRRNPAGVQRHLRELAPRSLAAGAHFLENHDEPRIASLLSPSEHRAAAALILSLPGLRLLHDGQLEGAQIKVPVQYLGCRREPPVAEIANFYERMLTLLLTTPIGRGRANLLVPTRDDFGNTSFQNLVVVRWEAEPAAFDLMIVNLAAEPARGKVALDGIAANRWKCRDRWTGEDYILSNNRLRDGSFTLELPGKHFQWLQFQSAI